MSTIKINDENFKDEVINSNKTTIVDFYADWCGPCKMMSPIIDEISENKEIKVGKVNVDESQQLAIKYNIMSIPTILVFKKGELVKSFVGVHDKNEILNSL